MHAHAEPRAASAPASGRDNQREHEPPPDARRRVVFQQGFLAKPTAYAPYGSQEDHPLRDAHVQMQARLQALRDVRGRLRFVARDSMAIATRVALSTQPTTDDWVQRGGILALDGLETLFLGFLTTHELVTAGAVCQSWYALARRDAFWEPLLLTPVEKYPLRAFLGFPNSSSVPAIQVYIIYRKIRAQLQRLDAKDDESPRQSPDALRFEELFLRYRRAATNHNDDQGLLGEDDEFAMLPPPTLTRRRSSRGSGAAATGNGARKLHLRSVHLVYPADEDLSSVDEDTPMLGGGFHDEEIEVDVPLVPQPRAPLNAVLAPQEPLHQRDQFFVPADIESDEEIWIDGEAHSDDDVAMLPPDGSMFDQHAGRASPSVLDACRRVRLLTWLTRCRTVSRNEFRAFARQLLVALATLEASQVTHSDVCIGNILVIDRGSTPTPHAHGATDNQRAASSEATQPPLVQLYCRSSVNIWSSRALSPPTMLRPRPRLGVLTAPLLPPARNVAEILAHRARHHHGLLAALIPPPDLDEDDDQHALRRLLAARALPRAPQEEERALPQAPTQAPSSASYNTMVRCYLRILREVWTHGRVAATNERNLPFLSLIFLRPNLVKSASFRSFIEYGEYLLSRNEATPTKLLNHIFLQLPDCSGSPRSHRVDAARFVVGRSPLRPTSYANAEDYRSNAITWHARYLTTHHAQHAPRQAANNTDAIRSLTTAAAAPTTLFGPAFFHDALSESRLPLQRFLSVAAPRTASSSWVHTLAVSQRLTLQQLDLSHVELPLSILLRELHHLQRLTHLRLPRVILREENLEQFVAELWCSGLLPTLEVMDDNVKTALDKIESGYVKQLSIMSLSLENAVHRPPLHHTFSSPF